VRNFVSHIKERIQVKVFGERVLRKIVGRGRK
jgi:hypothetical protein